MIKILRSALGVSLVMFSAAISTHAADESDWASSININAFKPQVAGILDRYQKWRHPGPAERLAAFVDSVDSVETSARTAVAALVTPGLLPGRIQRIDAYADAMRDSRRFLEALIPSAGGLDATQRTAAKAAIKKLTDVSAIISHEGGESTLQVHGPRYWTAKFQDAILDMDKARREIIDLLSLRDTAGKTAEDRISVY